MPHKNRVEWTREKVAALRVHWEEGLSATVIGRSLGFSKNAVIGKARRLGLPSRPSVIRAKPGPRKKSPKRLDDAPPRRRDSNGFQPRACQFIKGHPSEGDAGKCGEPVHNGSSYCAEHHARCYTQLQPDRRRTGTDLHHWW